MFCRIIFHTWQNNLNSFSWLNQLILELVSFCRTDWNNILVAPTAVPGCLTREYSIIYRGSGFVTVVQYDLALSSPPPSLPSSSCLYFSVFLCRRWLSLLAGESLVLCKSLNTLCSLLTEAQKWVNTPIDTCRWLTLLVKTIHNLLYDKWAICYYESDVSPLSWKLRELMLYYVCSLERMQAGTELEYKKKKQFCRQCWFTRLIIVEGPRSESWQFLVAFFWRKRKIEFLFWSMNNLLIMNILEYPSNLPLQSAYSYFQIATCDSKSCSESRLWYTGHCSENRLSLAVNSYVPFLFLPAPIHLVS